jgi:hypothetical protein
LANGSSKVILGDGQTQKEFDSYFSGNGTECPQYEPLVI